MTTAAAAVPRARPAAVLTACCLAVFLIALNTTAINSAVNAIADELEMDATTMAFAINAYLIGVAVFVVPAGRLVDVVGLTAIFATGLAVFAVGSAAIAVAQDGVPVILGRALQGAGSAFLMPGTMSAIGLAYPAERRGGALGIWGAVAGLGFAIGPLYGGVLTDTLGWRWIYYGDFLIIAATALVALPAVKALPRPGRATLDILGSALLGVAVLLLVLFAQYGRAWGWSSAATIGCLIGGIAFLIAFVEEDRHRSARMRLMEFGLLRLPAYLGGNLVTGVSSAVLVAFLYFFNLYAQSPVTLGESAVVASVLLLPYGLMIVITSVLAGRMVDTTGFRIPVAAGMAVGAVGLLMLADVGPSERMRDLLIPLILVGIGTGFTFSTASAASMSVVPPEQAGEAAGTLNVSRYLLAALTMAVCAAISLTVSLGRFETSLEAQGVTGAEREDLDAGLTGTTAGLEHAIDAVPGATRQTVETAAGLAITDGFRVAMALLAAISVIGAIISATTLPGRRRAQ